MAALRKTLGNSDSPYVVSIRALMATQSKATVARWCLDYARRYLLPIYKKSFPADTRGEEVLLGAELWLAGAVKLPVVKPLILAAHAAAREADGDPAAQAAIRAVAHAASVIHSVRHALGIIHYGTAALAYDQLGLEESRETYDQFAAREAARMEEALQRLIRFD